MKDPYGLSKATFPASYAQLLIEIVVERGISAEQLLTASHLPSALFAVADGRITPRQWSRMVWKAMKLTGDMGIGCEYGLRLRPTAHGVLGFAAMSCATLSQALELGAVFFSMRLRDYSIKIRTEGDIGIIEIIEMHPVICATPEQTQALRRFYHENIMLGIVHAGRFLTGDHLPVVELYVDWPEPSYHAHYQDRMPPMRFGQSSNQIRGPASCLQLPLVLADPMAHQQALVQCEQEQSKHSNIVDELVARVKAELILTHGVGYPSLDAIAIKLHMSGRTLKRHLQSLNTTYIELLDIVRQQDAKKLLMTTKTDIQSISGLLGYAEPANFTRAFKKWTGETPSQFRQRIRI
jgi:AraC-like DNA-binding protein